MSPTNHVAIPVLDPQPDVALHWEELMAAIAGVLRSGTYIMGPQVAAFEAEVAAYLGVRHAIGVNSGTDALVIALRALGLGAGDEVITTPFTFFATAEAVSAVGATPVFVDVDRRTFNLDPAAVEAAVTARTRAILPVHLYGQAADMDRLQAIADAHGLRIVEDVAQAFGGTYRGRKLGTLGAFGAFSFFPSKNLGAYGDGGLIATDDDELAASARMLRVHGSRKKYFNEVIGYNSRLDELQAAILRVKLPHLEASNAGRREAAGRYDRLLAGLAGVETPYAGPDAGHVYHQYTVRIAGGLREAVRTGLEARGVSTMVYYPVPLHQLPPYLGGSAALPLAEAAAAEAISLPIWPSIRPEVQERVADALADALAAARG